MDGVGGPTARVLFAESIDEAKVHSLMRQAFVPSEHWAGDWYCSAPSAFGMPADLIEAGPAGVYVQPPSRIKPQLTEAIGFHPATAITVSMGCNQKVDHRLAGHLCLVLALEFDGVIDFFGSLVPFPWPDDIPIIRPTPEQRAELARRIARGMRRMPGHLYVVDGGHLGDVEFLDGWLRHPSFRMIK